MEFICSLISKSLGFGFVSVFANFSAAFGGGGCRHPGRGWFTRIKFIRFEFLPYMGRVTDGRRGATFNTPGV